MKASKVIAKATLMATCIFWIFIFSKDFELFMIALIPLSMIPISICCATTILLTIMPFFWSKSQGMDNRTVLKKYFPFYAIISFGICLYGTIVEPSIVSFFASAFFTVMQCWVWLGKEIKIKPLP